MLVQRSMLAAALILATTAAGCGAQHPMATGGAVVFTLGAVLTAAAISAIPEDDHCEDWAPLEAQCSSFKDTMNGIAVLPGVALALTGLAFVIEDASRPLPRGDAGTSSISVPALPPRAAAPEPAITPAARRVLQRLRMQVTADLCRAAAATLDELRAIDAAAAERAVAEPATAACVAR